jgi:SNF2 family DNA or RNA helicase
MEKASKDKTMNDELREKIAWILYCEDTPEEQRTSYERFIQPFVMCKEGFKEYWNKATKILSLFDISKVMVEEECDRCDNGYLSYSSNLNPNTFKEGGHIKCSKCQGTGTITRPAEWSDIQKDKDLLNES